MFDPGTRPAILLALGDDFAVKTTVQATAQERQNILGGETHGGVIQQPLIKWGEFIRSEDHIRAVFKLVDVPTIFESTQQFVFHQRIQRSDPIVEAVDPSHVGKTIGKLLNSFGLVELREAIVFLHKTDAMFDQLAL